MSMLFKQALAGEATPRRPLWIMRQAGRYLPEYRELRKRATFEELCADADLSTEVTLMPMKRFPLDAAVVFADLMTPFEALGIAVRFAPGPVLERPVRTAAEIRALPEVEADIAPTLMTTLGRVRRELAADKAVLGFAGGPWSLAAYLVQGQGKNGFPALRALMRGEPALFGELMGKLSRLSARYLREQVAAGADAVQVFESWIGLLSEEDFVLHVKPHLKTLLEDLAPAGAPRILFLQGAPHLVAACADLPMDGLALCWRANLTQVREQLRPDLGLQGNLDPTILLAGPEATRRHGQQLLSRMPPRGHIVNLGHGILPETPLSSVEALIELVHQEEATS